MSESVGSKELERIVSVNPEVPDLSHLVAISKSFERLTEHFQRFAENWDDWFEPLREPLRNLGEASDQCKVFEEAGWLPHWSTPFHLIDDQDETFDDRVHSHYQDNWPEVSLELLQSVRKTTDDPETNAVFEEAIAAHSHGLYRASTRLVFPEIERVARNRLHGGNVKKRITSQRELIQALGGLNPVELKSRGIAGFRLFMALARHTYAKSETKEQIDRFQNSDIPNRHALLHGVVPYSSEKASLNALFLFDYVMDAIQVIVSNQDKS